MEMDAARGDAVAIRVNVATISHNEQDRRVPGAAREAVGKRGAFAAIGENCPAKLNHCLGDGVVTRGAFSVADMVTTMSRRSNCHLDHGMLRPRLVKPS